MRATIIAGGLTGLVIAGAAALAAAQFTAPGPLPEARDVVIPHGDVAPAIRNAGVIAHPLAFRAAELLTVWRGPLHAAELRFPAHASVLDVLAVLRTARPVQHRLTIVEGSTAARVAATLADAPGLVGPVPVPPEGGVYPDTYDYERGTTVSALLARAEAAASRHLADAWSTRDPNLPLATPGQALALASMVERETALPRERPLIARVFLNRLRLGMRLQSDPTTLYAVGGGMLATELTLTRADLAFASPYNTYVAANLPSGPICNPGRASLLAVLHPIESRALYFVADGSGGHAFSDTLVEHEQNVRAAARQIRN